MSERVREAVSVAGAARVARFGTLRRLGAGATLLAVVLGAAAPAAAQSEAGIGMAEPRTGTSGVVVREEQWARSLVRALGLGEMADGTATSEDLFALLCADQAEMTTDVGGQRVPARAEFRVTREMMEGRGAGEPVRVVLDVPATALYQIAVEGTGKQRWTVDQRPVGHIDPSALGVAFGPRVLPLAEGPHELAGYLTPHSRVDRVELNAHRPLCIAPAAGWREGRPLTGGGQARTLARALGLDRYLPEEQVLLHLEGEEYTSTTASGMRTNADPTGRLAVEREEWAKAGDEPAEFSYEVRLPEPGVFSVFARVVSGSQQIWSIDGRYRTRMDVEESPEAFVWGHVMTTSLVAGTHTIRALVPAGSGIDRLRIEKRQSADADYLEVVAQMGFPVRSVNAYVTRSGAFEALTHPAFQELSASFLERMAGSSSEPPLVALDDRIPPLYSRPLSPALPSEL